MSNRTALVIGYGSAGARHARVLTELGFDVKVSSRRPLGVPDHYASLAQALEVARPSYVVIATETARHFEDVSALASADYSGHVLVEKPLFARPAPVPAHRFASLSVGYNLRFDPVLGRVREFIGQGPALSVDVYVGQYLPTWRPGRDYRKTASAAAGSGGVLRDLSHELDYLIWLFGPWRRLSALGGHLSDLELASDDAYGLLLEMERCPLVTLHMNYLDRLGARRLAISCAHGSVHADLFSRVVATEAGSETLPLERDASYRAMHEAVLRGDPTVCDVASGLSVVELILAAERSAGTRWVSP